MTDFRRPIVFLFGGQGSQYYGMGAELFARNDVFRSWMEFGDRFLRDLVGRSVLDAMHEPGRSAADPFDQLGLTHPAIVLTEYALAKVLENCGIRPDWVAGVSLGEIASMAVAGMLPFEGALSIAARQPQLFEATCPPGLMIGCLASAEQLCADPLLGTETECAGISGPKHTVLALPTNVKKPVEARLKSLGVVHQVLPVPFAFHSRWIDPAEAAVCRATGHLRLGPPTVLVWSTAHQKAVTVTPVGQTNPDLVWQIVRSPMRLAQTLRAFESQGGATYVDLSPSGTLAGLARQSIGPRSNSAVHAILTPFSPDLVALERLTDALAKPSQRCALSVGSTIA